MFELSAFATFLVTGGIAAFVNIASRWLFQFAVSYEIAVTLAFVCGVTTGFALAKLFVFKGADGSARGQFARFLVVNLAAFPQVFVVSELLSRVVFPAIGFAWQPRTVAHVIGVISPVAVSYILHKRFSFRRVAT